MTALLRDLQDRICAALTAVDGSPFREESWERPGGGGGRSRLVEGGPVLERGGVNFSEVHGELPEKLALAMPGAGRDFFATGLSLVLHPKNPMAPTVHLNYRYFERGDAFWFGGGSDLTPAYLFEDDARHFHGALKRACDPHGIERYPAFKRGCDDYFLIRHRGERRGLGGIFFDHLRGDGAELFSLVRDCGEAFFPSYLPILERRRESPFGERERAWQLLRRGRYVEFNLVYDRGTLFGLETNGRVESILMSLPPLARWSSGGEPAAGSEEAKLLAVLREPKEWV
ncbi:MAG: oxygen-dependent coproporphyrinogen oxidase [Deltaproteobacteria bacterium]